MYLDLEWFDFDWMVGVILSLIIWLLFGGGNCCCFGVIFVMVEMWVVFWEILCCVELSIIMIFGEWLKLKYVIMVLYCGVCICVWVIRDVLVML